MSRCDPPGCAQAKTSYTGYKGCMVIKKVKITIKNNDEAFALVEDLMTHAGQYALFSGDCKECVDAKSFLGVLYFMLTHPNDTYLYSDSGYIPEQFVSGEGD